MHSHSNATKKLLEPSERVESKNIESKSYTSYLSKHIKKPWVESYIPFFKEFFHTSDVMASNYCHPDNLCINLILACAALPFCLTCGAADCMCKTIPAPCNAYNEMKRDKDRFFSKPSLAPSVQTMDESENPKQHRAKEVATSMPVACR